MISLQDFGNVNFLLTRNPQLDWRGFCSVLHQKEPSNREYAPKYMACRPVEIAHSGAIEASAYFKPEKRSTTGLELNR
jgi:hypothetical protein